MQNCAAGQEARERYSAMRENQNQGFHYPNAERKEVVVLAAKECFCTVCGSKPCYLLLSAATAAIQEQLAESGDLISGVRYAQNLERLHHCLTKHMETAEREWQLDKHFQLSENALHELEIQEMQKRLQAKTQTEARDP
jgi:hypothetical protein